MKAIAAVIASLLLTSSTVSAQDTIVRPPGPIRQSIAREAARLAEHPVTSGLQPQAAPQRTWAGRHPVALGAIIGAGGGAIWGAAACGTCNGSDGQTTQLWMGIGAGAGAAIGAAVGALISAVRR